MKAILIDDEPHTLSNLRAFLETYCPQINVCALAINAETSNGFLRCHQSHLVNKVFIKSWQKDDGDSCY